MGISFVYCVICGCPFDIPPRDDVFDQQDSWASDDPLEDETKQWLCRIRLLGANHSLEKFTTRPFCIPRNESTTQDLFISELADWAITEGLDFRLGGSSYRVLSPADGTDDVLFPLHDDCLTILQHALTWHARLSPQDGPPPSMANVYKALCVQFTFNLKERTRIAESGFTDYMDYGLEFDHGYYGAREFWAAEGWEPIKANEWYCNDPINVQSLSGFILTLLAEQPSGDGLVGEEAKFSEGVSTSKTGPLSSLEHLPREIMDLVTAILPTPSVLRLRMCSKTLMSQIDLDQQFWRKQLLDGCTVPYLWDLREIDHSSGATVGETLSHRNWKGLAQMLARRDDIIKEDEAIPSLPWGLRNRCRIWALATHLVALSEA